MRQALGLRNVGGRNEIVPQRHDQPRRGRHFVRDGEVPVVVLQNTRDHGGENGAPTNRFEIAENARRAEHAARERAERALHDAQETIQHLKTQLAHAEIAHAETLAAERLRTATAEAAMREAIRERESLELRVSELTAQNRVLFARAERAQAERAQAERAQAERAQAERAQVERAQVERAEVARVQAARFQAERTPSEPIAPPQKRKPGPKPRQTAKVTSARESQPVKWWLPSAKAKSR